MKKLPFLAFIVSLIIQTNVYADNYALIMGISDYPSSPLLGIPKDIEHATELAESMNIPSENIMVKKDGQLDLDGMRMALAEFERKIQSGDRAFIYFSGHGRSFSKSAGMCEKAIVTREGESLTRNEFQNRIQPIIDRAAKTFVFLDTCFSGGVIDSSKATRSDEEIATEQKPKALHKPNDPCAQASNFDYTGKGDRDFSAEATTTANYYLLGAASPTEYAIDGGSRRGSLATTAFVSCATSGSSADQNSDSVITLSEAYQCAQGAVNRLISPPYLSQTLTEGNGPGGNIPVAFEMTANNTRPSTTAVLAGSQSNSVNSQNLMETITHSADAKHRVRITPTKTSYKIGADFLEMDVSSSKSGYLTIFSVGSSGDIFQLFPNQYDSNNGIQANGNLLLPRTTWRIRANGPAGKDRFVAIVSGTPDRFAGLGVPVTPYRKITNNAEGAKSIIVKLINPGQDCTASKADQRDFGAEQSVPSCSSSYGAGYADVQEVD